MTKPLSDERYSYIQRIIKNTAKDNYPITGHRGEFRYDDWIARNFSEEITFNYENTTLLDNEMVWSVHASITDFIIDYVTGQYEDNKDQDDIPVIIDQHKYITETKINYINTITFTCSRNLAITLVEQSFDATYMNIVERFVMTEIDIDKTNLLKEAEKLKELCDQEFSNGIFVP